MGGCNFGNIPDQCTKMSQRGEILCFLTRNFQSRQNSFIWNLDFTLLLRILLKDEAMNTLIKERHNHSENCITVKVSGKTQKVEIYLSIVGSGVAFCSTDLGHIFGSFIGNQFAVMLRRKGPHKLKFAYDIVRIHSLIIYTDLIEHNIVGDTEALLLRCFPFISRLKSGDLIITGQYMNYQTFSNLQFKPLLKNSFHSIHIDLRDTSGRKELCICWYHSSCFDVQKSLQHSFLT